VRVQHPHLRLADRSGYEGKGLSATWRCTLHDREFRANASHLVRPVAVGCPDCMEETKRRKRRKLRYAPNLEQHLVLIRRHLNEDYARTYRMHCEGVKWEKIGGEFGISNQGVQGRLRRIASVLRGRR